MWLFLANKPLGIVHWHAEIRRKLLILCTECSKKLTQIVTFSDPNVLNPLSSLNMHLIIKNALLWDQKFLNWRDLSIFKNAVLILSSTTVQWLVSPEYRICKDFYHGRIKCFTKNQLGSVRLIKDIVCYWPFLITSIFETLSFFSKIMSNFWRCVWNSVKVKSRNICHLLIFQQTPTPCWFTSASKLHHWGQGSTDGVLF